MDAFSQVLSTVKLTGAFYFNAEFSCPWGFESPKSTMMAPLLMPGATHLIMYHLLLDGRGAAKPIDGDAVELNPGDIVVFPHGDPHIMWGGEFGHWVSMEEITRRLQTRDLGPMHAGGGGEKSRFVCGYMACDDRLCQPILNALPKMLRVSIREDASGRWLESSIRHMVEETAGAAPGSEAMLAKLSEALFVETLRRYLATLPSEEAGWLSAARDQVVGKALSLMHARPAEPWTIATLAQEVSVSRSSLAERFSKFLPETPMAYLTGLRLRLGANALLSTSKGVAEIAADVGYESEAAFNRAFKREFGEPPARYRKQQRGTAVAARGS